MNIKKLNESITKILTENIRLSEMSLDLWKSKISAIFKKIYDECSSFKDDYYDDYKSYNRDHLKDFGIMYIFGENKPQRIIGFENPIYCDTKNDDDVKCFTGACIYNGKAELTYTVHEGSERKVNDETFFTEVHLGITAEEFYNVCKQAVKEIEIIKKLLKEKEEKANRETERLTLSKNIMSEIIETLKKDYPSLEVLRIDQGTRGISVDITGWGEWFERDRRSRGKNLDLIPESRQKFEEIINFISEKYPQLDFWWRERLRAVLHISVFWKDED